MDRTELWAYLEKSLTGLVGSISTQLDEKNREILVDFIENREFGLSLEWLHSLVGGLNIELSERQQVETRKLAEFIGIDLSKER